MGILSETGPGVGSSSALLSDDPTSTPLSAVAGANVTYDEIEKLFSNIPTFLLRETELFLEGDHWQNQLGWIGWRPESASRTAFDDWTMIEQGFTSKNVIKSIVNRVKGAVLGKEPDWQIVSIDELNKADDTPPVPMPPVIPPPTNGNGAAPVPTLVTPPTPPKTTAQIEWEGVDKIMNDWWVDKRVHRALKRFIRHYAAYGKASIQIYIPKGYLIGDGSGGYKLNIQTQSNLEEVLCKIYVDTPGYAHIIDAEDENFGEDYVCLRLRKSAEEDENTYEVHYVDENEITHIRQVERESEGTEAEIAVDLGGNLLTFITGEYFDALISRPVKQQQRQLNHAKTMEGYAIANINFPETTFINASMETEQSKDPLGNTVETVKPLFRGLGRYLNLIGITTVDSQGSEKIATPDVRYKDVANPEHFAKVADNNTRDMHQEASMLYVLLANSPYPSGDSRIEAMTDYLILLVDFKTLIDTVGVWLLQTVLRLAFNFTGETNKNDQFAVLFSTKLTIGRISPADKEIMLQEVAANLRSKRNYMITAEVTDDPNIELEAISLEPQAPLMIGNQPIPSSQPVLPAAVRLPKTQNPTGVN